MSPAAVVPFLLVAPPAFAASGARRARGQAQAPVRWTRLDWRFGAASMLCCVLAFDLVFFVQELFLVLPKPLLPGVRPVLFHNGHAWAEDHVLVQLFRGTGTLATLLPGPGCAAWLRQRGGTARAPRGDVARMLAWLGLAGGEGGGGMAGAAGDGAVRAGAACAAAGQRAAGSVPRAARMDRGAAGTGDGRVLRSAMVAGRVLARCPRARDRPAATRGRRGGGCWRCSRCRRCSSRGCGRASPPV